MIEAPAVPELFQVARPLEPRPRGAEPRSSEQRRAFEAIVVAHMRPLTRLARYWCRDQAEADDLLQDTLERAYVSLQQMDLGTNPRAWLITIMRNQFVDRRRRQARTRCGGDVALTSLAAPSPEAVAPWRSIDSSELETALLRLDSELRMAFVLRWRERQSYRQIADRLRIPINTVGTRLHRARRSIRRLLEEGASRRSATVLAGPGAELNRVRRGA